MTTQHTSSDGSTPRERPAYTTKLIFETTGPGGTTRLHVDELFSTEYIQRMVANITASSSADASLTLLMDIQSGFKRIPLKRERDLITRNASGGITASTVEGYKDIPVGASIGVASLFEGQRTYRTYRTYTHLGDGVFGITTYRQG